MIQEGDVRVRLVSRGAQLRVGLERAANPTGGASLGLPCRAVCKKPARLHDLLADVWI